MNPRTLHNLELASDGEFAYRESDAASVVELALQDSDPAVATSALGELTRRDSDDASNVARQILQRDIWDPHLTAYALTVLYTRDPDGAFGAMQRILPATSHKSILEAMIENVLSDRARYTTGVGRELVAELVGRLTDNVVAQLDPLDVSQLLALHRGA